MRDPQYIEITRPDGQTFRANRYIVENGPNRHVMIYWYQGRGRIEASEYTDKINTVWAASPAAAATAPWSAS